MPEQVCVLFSDELGILLLLGKWLFSPLATFYPQHNGKTDKNPYFD